MKDDTKVEELDALRRSRDFFENIIENIGDPTMVIDSNYHILYTNKAMQNAFDGRNPFAEQLCCYQVVHHLDRPCSLASPGSYPCPLEKVISTKASARVTHIHHDEMNNIIFMEIIASPIFDDRGEVSQIVESIRDITTHKRYQEKFDRLIIELQGALARIKRMSGLLPICMSCKKIRDDKGYWQKVETYVREHSDAEFTHGLCPECEHRLYDPEKDKGENNDLRGGPSISI